MQLRDTVTMWFKCKQKLISIMSVGLLVGLNSRIIVEQLN